MEMVQLPTDVAQMALFLHLPHYWITKDVVFTAFAVQLQMMNLRQIQALRHVSQGPCRDLKACVLQICLTRTFTLNKALAASHRKNQNDI